MCGRFTVTTKDTKSIADRFQVELEKAPRRATKAARPRRKSRPRTANGGEAKEKSPPGLGRFNVAPTQEILVVRSSPDEAEAEQGEREARLMRWGLVPVWAKDLKVGYRMINAKTENLTKSKAYGPLVGKFRHRCLIVADGFYEWMKAEDPKQPRQPWRFTVDGGEPFAFAGLCTRKEWDDPEERGVDPDGYLYSATIITTTPNAVVKPVHDRMPAILSERRGRGRLARSAALDRGGDRDVRAARRRADGRGARQSGAQQGRQRDGRRAGAAGRARSPERRRRARGALFAFFGFARSFFGFFAFFLLFFFGFFVDRRRDAAASLRFRPSPCRLGFRGCRRSAPPAPSWFSRSCRRAVRPSSSALPSRQVVVEVLGAFFVFGPAELDAFDRGEAFRHVFGDFFEHRRVVAVRGELGHHRFRHRLSVDAVFGGARVEHPQAAGALGDQRAGPVRVDRAEELAFADPARPSSIFSVESTRKSE